MVQTHVVMMSTNKHKPPLHYIDTKEQYVSHSETNTNSSIHQTTHDMQCNGPQLGCQLLVAQKYSVYHHYSPRCRKIHTIDQLKPSLFLRGLHNYLWRHPGVYLLIYIDQSTDLTPGIEHIFVIITNLFSTTNT